VLWDRGLACETRYHGGKILHPTTAPSQGADHSSSGTDIADVQESPYGIVEIVHHSVHVWSIVSAKQIFMSIAGSMDRPIYLYTCRY
jgi:hypothetical protein